MTYFDVVSAIDVMCDELAVNKGDDVWLAEVTECKGGVADGFKVLSTAVVDGEVDVERTEDRVDATSEVLAAAVVVDAEVNV